MVIIGRHPEKKEQVEQTAKAMEEMMKKCSDLSISATLLLGDDATSDNVFKALESQPDLVLIISHGEVDKGIRPFEHTIAFD